MNCVSLNMNLTSIPFAKLIRLQEGEGDYLFCLAAHQDYTNHLGTVAAAAQFSLAEFASGQWLLYTFPDMAEQVVPMLRNSQVKFNQATTGRICAKVNVSKETELQVAAELKQLKRSKCTIPVKVMNDQGHVVMTGHFEWILMIK